MNNCCVCNNNDTINVTRGTDINLIVSLSREGNPFPVELCDGVQVNVISEYGHRHTVSFEMGIGRLLVTIIAEEYKVGMYGIEVKGMLNGMSWLTFGSKIFKYTYETRNGLSSTNNAGDPYDVLLEVTHVADAIPKNISDLNDDVGLITDPDYVHTDNNFTDEDKEKLNLIQDGWTTRYLQDLAFDEPLSVEHAVLTFVQNPISQPSGQGEYIVQFDVPQNDLVLGKIYESIFILKPTYDTRIMIDKVPDIQSSGEDMLVGGKWNYVKFTWAVTATSRGVSTGYLNVEVHTDFASMIKNIDLSAYVPKTEKGAINGVASLGNDGKVPLEQLPPIPADNMIIVKIVDRQPYGEFANYSAGEIYDACLEGKLPVFINGNQVYYYDKDSTQNLASFYQIDYNDYSFNGVSVNAQKKVEEWATTALHIPTSLAELSEDTTHRVMTDTEKTKLADLPTASALTTALSNKQDKLTWDNTPTAGSDNPVKSSGIKTELDKKQDKTLVEQVAFTAGQSTAKSIDPNKIYECTYVDVMSFAFNSTTVTNTEKCEYCIKFNVGAAVPTLTLPNIIKWAEELELNASTHYVLLINYENGGYYGDWKGYEL